MLFTVVLIVFFFLNTGSYLRTNQHPCMQQLTPIFYKGNPAAYRHFLYAYVSVLHVCESVYPRKSRFFAPIDYPLNLKLSVFLAEVPVCQYPDGKKVCAPCDKCGDSYYICFSICHADEHTRHRHNKAADEKDSMYHH